MQLKELTKDIIINNQGPTSSRIKGVQKVNFVKSADPDSNPSEMERSGFFVKASDPEPPKMPGPGFPQGGDLHSVPGNPEPGGNPNDPYSEFQRAMNDSGVPLSSEPYNQTYHYGSGPQNYGEGYDYSKEVDNYLKQWAEYYQSQHGQDPNIRYDYKTFQNQSDPNEAPAEADSSQVQNVPQAQSEPQVKRKIISPGLNFVKASSEFKSTDIAEKEDPMKNVMLPSVLAGKNRLGLGAGKKKGGASHTSQVCGFTATGKTSSTYLNTKFNSLCKEVKGRSNPSKNAIEILHQSADKCKMPINCVYHTNERMADGRIKYTCVLEIAGVFVSDGGAPSKKVAKMEAYSKASAIFTDPPVMVKEKSDGQLFVIKKVEIGPSQPDQSNSVSENAKSNQNTAAKPDDNNKVQEAYAKPKMVFHKASEPAKPAAPIGPTSHPLSDKPLEFKKPEPTSKPSTVASAASGSRSNDSAFTGTSESTDTRPGTRVDQKSEPEIYDPWANSRPGQHPRGNNFQRQDYHHSDTFQRQSYPGHDRFQRQNYPGSDRYHRQNYPHDWDSGSDRFERQNYYGSDRYQRQNYPHDWDSGFQRTSFQREGEGTYKRGGDRFDSPSAIKKVRNSTVVLEDLSDFIIMDYSKLSPNINATSILHNSANFNRVVLKYQFEEIQGFGWRCKLILSDNEVVSSFGSTKEDAKKAAGEEALTSLREICYSIVVKQDVDSDEIEGLTKDEFVSEIQKGGNVIPDNNVGNMLLRKMGWSGGGVGKHGTGIAEPIKADQVIGREGLGLTASKGIDQSFHQKVQDMLVNYTRSNDQNDLHFSPEFTKEERAVIHKAAQKYGLKSHSKGKDEDRFLIISRKRSASQLLDHVMSSGGTTSKYEVVAPTNQQEGEEYFARDRKPVWNAVSYGHDKQ